MNHGDGQRPQPLGRVANARVSAMVEKETDTLLQVALTGQRQGCLRLGPKAATGIGPGLQKLVRRVCTTSPIPHPAVETYTPHAQTMG